MNPWAQYKADQRLRRRGRLMDRSASILALKRQGYDVEQRAANHFRINGRLDLFPIHNQWHDLKTGERGGAKDLAIFVKERIRHYEGR